MRGLLIQLRKTLDVVYEPYRGLATGAPLPTMSRRDMLRCTLFVGHAMPEAHRPPIARDDVLIVLVDELRGTRDALNELLRGDERDASDIPTFTALADRHIALAQAVCEIQARSREGLFAKARAVDARDAALRTETAIALSMSLAADVLAFADEPDSDFGRLDPRSVRDVVQKTRDWVNRPMEHRQ